MTEQNYPITPPDELVRHWSRFQGDTNPEALWFRIANEAAQWGADQELEACCEWFVRNVETADKLRAARRPKSPSLKEQALDQLKSVEYRYGLINTDYIRRALESIPDPS